MDRSDIAIGSIVVFIILLGVALVGATIGFYLGSNNEKEKFARHNLIFLDGNDYRHECIGFINDGTNTINDIIKVQF